MRKDGADFGKSPAQGQLFGDIAVVVFLVAQASDGVLTYVGVATYGRGIEGNPLIGWLMTASLLVGLGAAVGALCMVGITGGGGARRGGGPIIWGGGGGGFGGGGFGGGSSGGFSSGGGGNFDGGGASGRW